jgi:subtilisin family serine protease
LTSPDQIGAVSSAITHNGGTVHDSYERIGVVVARSAEGGFATKMREVSGVTHVGATRTRPLGVTDPTPVDRQMLERVEERSGPTSVAAETPEWDMTAIGADKAWEINTGKSSVVTGIIDTGIDDTHEDLSANFDAGSSVSCVGGKPDTGPGAWRPDAAAEGSYHGTHVAGTVAAAKNGKGVVGVAPGTRVAAIRVSEGDKSFFYAENVVCAFMWAAQKKLAVTNNSYYVDPWMYTCSNDPDQAAIAEGVRRAMMFAEANGTLNVVALGNAGTDFAAEQRKDATSPNDGTPQNRDLTNACLSIPQEVPGAVNVTATTNTSTKAPFSNYGLDKADLAAPGASVNSTLPGNKYGVLSGTSMAAPHVAGVAALLAGTDNGVTPGRLRALLRTQATDWSCADHGNEPACTGPATKNSYFGEGLVNAAAAVGG